MTQSKTILISTVTFIVICIGFNPTLSNASDLSSVIRDIHHPTSHNEIIEFKEHYYTFGIDNLNGDYPLAIYRSKTGESWRLVADNFGNGRASISGAIVFQDRLYVAISNYGSDDTQVYVTSDGISFALVSQLDVLLNNSYATDVQQLYIFQDELYILTSLANQTIEAYKSNDGAEWEVIDSTGYIVNHASDIRYQIFEQIAVTESEIFAVVPIDDLYHYALLHSIDGINWSKINTTQNLPLTFTKQNTHLSLLAIDNKVYLVTPGPHSKGGKRFYDITGGEINRYNPEGLESIRALSLMFNNSDAQGNYYGIGLNIDKQERQRCIVKTNDFISWSVQYCFALDHTIRVEMPLNTLDYFYVAKDKIFILYMNSYKINLSNFD